MAPVEAADPPAGRALLLLVLFLLGCAAAAVVMALGLGTVWHEVYAWVFPQVAGDALAP